LSFNTEKFEEMLGMGYDYLLIWGDESGPLDSAWFMSKLDMSSQMKSHRETDKRYDLWYIIMQTKAIIRPRQIFTGFERL